MTRDEEHAAAGRRGPRRHRAPPVRQRSARGGRTVEPLLPGSPAADAPGDPMAAARIGQSARDQQAFIDVLAAGLLGRTPSRETSRAARRYWVETIIPAVLREVPKGIYQQAAGITSHGQAEAQAARYGIPIHGPTVDLTAVIHWVHRFLAEHGRRLTAVDTDEVLFDGESAPALERMREARARLYELDLRERTGQLIDRAAAMVWVGRIARAIRGAGEQLGRAYGPEAAQMIDDALEAVRGELNGNGRSDRPDGGNAGDPAGTDGDE
jgi:hypothetical protein